jgi:hypothetical protein
MADVVTIGDECDPGSFTTNDTGNNDIGFHCSGFAVYQDYILAYNSSIILDVLSADDSDEMFYTSDPSVDASIGTDYAGQGQGGFNVDASGFVSFDAQTYDGPFQVTVQSDASTAPEPAPVLLMLGALPILAFAVRKRAAAGLRRSTQSHI